MNSLIQLLAFEKTGAGMLNGIYSIIADIYALLLNIASLEIISDLSVEKMYLSIYVIIGVLVTFKLLYSLLNYLINPDKVSDSKSGLGNLIVRTIMMFGMLIAAPLVFQLLFRLQGYIISDNIINTIFSPTSTNNQLLIKSDNLSFGDSCSQKWFDVPITTSGNGTECVYNSNSAQKFSNQLLGAFYSCKTADNDKDLENCNKIRKNALFYSTDAYEKSMNSGTLDINFIVSAIFGLFILIFLAVLCVDIAIRNMKLGMLQVLAPIPIVSYADSATEKHFKSWVGMVVSVYLELFIKLIAIALMDFLISDLSNSLANLDSGLLFIFIILALLTFVKTAPQFIASIFGIKMQDSSFGNMLKKSLGFVTGAAGGFLLGAASRGIGSAMAAEKRNRMKSLGKGLLEGAAMGTVGGSLAGATGKGVIKNTMGIVKNQAEAGAAATMSELVGGRRLDVGFNKIRRKYGLPTDKTLRELKLSSYDDFSSSYKLAEDAVMNISNVDDLNSEYQRQNNLVYAGETDEQSRIRRNAYYSARNKTRNSAFAAALAGSDVYDVYKVYTNVAVADFDAEGNPIVTKDKNGIPVTLSDNDLKGLIEGKHYISYHTDYSEQAKFSDSATDRAYAQAVFESEAIAKETLISNKNKVGFKEVMENAEAEMRKKDSDPNRKYSDEAIADYVFKTRSSYKGASSTISQNKATEVLRNQTKSHYE